MKRRCCMCSRSIVPELQGATQQAVKEAVDFLKAKGLVPSHRLAPRIMVAYAEIRDLPARGNQSMTCAEYESTPASRDSLFFQNSQNHARLLADTLSQE